MDLTSSNKQETKFVEQITNKDNGLKNKGKKELFLLNLLNIVMVLRIILNLIHVKNLEVLNILNII